MAAYVLTSIVSGILFGIMDGVINANPLAQRVYAVYKPIAKTSLNIIAGVMIDLVYGFVMSGVFLLLYESLPGQAGIVKGIGFAVLVWFFRVVMGAASQWMMFIVPVRTLLYTAAAGLGEMLVLGILYGLVLQPSM